MLCDIQSLPPWLLVIRELAPSHTSIHEGGGACDLVIGHCDEIYVSLKVSICGETVERQGMCLRSGGRRVRKVYRNNNSSCTFRQIPNLFSNRDDLDINSIQSWRAYPYKLRSVVHNLCSDLIKSHLRNWKSVFQNFNINSNIHVQIKKKNEWKSFHVF